MLFKYLDSLFTKQPIDLKGWKTTPFVVNRFLSFDRGTFLLSNRLNGYLSKLPKWAVHYFLKHSIPKSDPPYIKYIRESEKNNSELLKKISEFFNISIEHAEQCKKILEQQGKDPYMMFGVKK